MNEWGKSLSEFSAKRIVVLEKMASHLLNAKTFTPESQPMVI